MKLNDIIPNAYIYLIYTNDNTINYYGMTTQTPTDRFYSHIDNYIKYFTNIKTDYCSSFIIFTNYDITQINYKTIEHHKLFRKKFYQKQKNITLFIFTFL